MIAQWRQLSTLTKVFYIGGLVSFIGLGIMILTGMTSIGAKWELLKLRRSAKTGPIAEPLAFLIRIWEGSMALKASREVFRMLDEPRNALRDSLVVRFMHYSD
jgi:ABC-type multidrug transport system fused ATPase/permease subunit